MFGQTSRISTECISNVLKVRAQVITIEPPFDLTTKVAAEFYNKKSLCSWIRDPTGLARVSSGHCEDCREPASNELPFKINGSKGSSWRDSSISRLKFTTCHSPGRGCVVKTLVVMTDNNMFSCGAFTAFKHINWTIVKRPNYSQT